MYLREKLNSILANHTGRSAEEIDRDTERDNFMSAEESVKYGMIDKVIAKFPQIKVLATTLREVHSTNRHSWSAVAWIDGQVVQAPTAELDVYDRVGGGDGYAAGFIYALPPAAIYYAFKRYMVGGLTAGAVKS